MSSGACGSCDSCSNQPRELLVFRKGGELGEEARLLLFLPLEDRGHVFPSFSSYHLEITLHLQKPSPGPFWSPGKQISFLLAQTGLCFFFSPKPTLGLSFPLLRLSFLPLISHILLSTCTFKSSSTETESHSSLFKNLEARRMWDSEYFRF